MTTNSTDKTYRNGRGACQVLQVRDKTEKISDIMMHTRSSFRLTVIALGVLCSPITRAQTVLGPEAIMVPTRSSIAIQSAQLNADSIQIATAEGALTYALLAPAAGNTLVRLESGGVRWGGSAPPCTTPPQASTKHCTPRRHNQLGPVSTETEQAQHRLAGSCTKNPVRDLR